MFILLAGGGKLGYYLAKALIQSGQEVTIIEKKDYKVERINKELGSVAMHGDACDPSVLAEAGCERADMVVAVTADDEDNLIICQVAKSKFKVDFSIARVANPRNEEIFKKLGVDAPVSSTALIFAVIEDEIAHHGVMTSLALRRCGVEIIEAPVTPESPAHGKMLQELSLPPHCTIAMVLRDNDTIVPNGQTRLQDKDVVIALAKHEQFADMRDLLMGPSSIG
ncbi:MAG: TrkA family potassium uptake protein [Proteobacteria bacterium]|nr:TrkA family potassium uptake protein [Pseudomonadota bacterium]